MSAKAIYAPRGRAKEYAELAVNLYDGCIHACQYCYVPGVLRKKKGDFHARFKPREGILARLERDANAMAGDRREVLLSFTSDPYQPGDTTVTRKALEILFAHRMRVRVLTKGGLRAERDFDLLKAHNGKYGTSLSFTESRLQWEPFAASVNERLEALRRARKQGIFTWVSVEPVIYPNEALAVMGICVKEGIVNEWRVGKINHNKALEAAVNWPQFLIDAKNVLKGQEVIFKKDLLDFGSPKQGKLNK